MEQTATVRGRSYAQDLVPFQDFEIVRSEQAATAAVRELAASCDFFISRAIDTAELTQRASAGSSLGGADLRAIADALSSAAAAHKKTHAIAALVRVTSNYSDLKDLVREIVNAIDERGNVLDRASPALGRIRKNLQRAQSEARDRMSALARSSKLSRAIQENLVTIREGRFVIPIKAEFAGEVPGIVHDTSSSGQTLFIEPLAALETNNRVRALRLEEEREVARILDGLSAQAGAQASRIEANVEMLALLDVTAAKARVAAAMDAAQPALDDEPILSIAGGRHPLLGVRAIPQSLVLNEETRMLVISGPNMGGKTVTLKMAGLFVLMAYAGLQVPSSGDSRIGRFTRIFADIGDEQSIAENTSTFSAHLNRMRETLAGADRHSLVLVDEIGGGTEPASGAALAIAMLERLLSAGAHAIVTTHSTELKLFAHHAAGVANASVRFDPRTFAPTYQLDVGAPGQSLAFPLARSLGLPGAIVQRAEELLGSQERDYERALAELSELTAQTQAQKEALKREQAHLEALQANLRSRMEALESERRKLVENAEARLQQALREFSAALEQKVTRGQAELLDRTLREMRRDLGMREDDLARSQSDEQPNNVNFFAGDRVRSLSLGQDGTVVADAGDTVLVGIGAMKTMLPKRDLRKVAASKKHASAQSGDVALAAAARTMPEIDVRGKRYVDAEPVLDRWIDDAIVAGNSPLRVIHGKGTGLLGRGIQEYLRAHPAVTNVRFGNEDEGGAGVTVFELR